MAEVREGRTYYGRAWVDGEYREPSYPSPLNVRVGEPGVKVVAIIRYLQAFDGDVDAVAKAWDPYLTTDDVESAVRFYLAHKDEIDEQLAADAAVA